MCFNFGAYAMMTHSHLKALCMEYKNKARLENAMIMMMIIVTTMMMMMMGMIIMIIIMMMIIIIKR